MKNRLTWIVSIIIGALLGGLPLLNEPVNWHRAFGPWPGLRVSFRDPAGTPVATDPYAYAALRPYLLARDPYAKLEDGAVLLANGTHGLVLDYQQASFASRTDGFARVRVLDGEHAGRAVYVGTYQYKVVGRRRRSTPTQQLGRAWHREPPRAPRTGRPLPELRSREAPGEGQDGPKDGRRPGTRRTGPLPRNRCRDNPTPGQGASRPGPTAAGAGTVPGDNTLPLLV